jgi:hypothetical protein
VDALAEGEVPVSVGAGDVEDVRVREPLGISVGRGQADRRLLPRRYHRPANLDVLLGDAPGQEVHRPPVTQRLLNHPLGQQLGIGPELCQLLGVGQQGHDAVADQVHRGHVPGEVHEEDRP